MIPVRGSSPQQYSGLFHCSKKASNLPHSVSTKLCLQEPQWTNLAGIQKEHDYWLSMKWHSSAGKKQGGGEQSLFSKNAPEQIFVEGINIC